MTLAADRVPVRLTCGLTNALIDAHAYDPEFGYRFLADELERAGHAVGERWRWRWRR